MSDAFTRAMDRLFNDVNVSFLSTYSSTEAGSVSVRCIELDPREAATGLTADSQLPGDVFEFRQSEVTSKPAEGDTMTDKKGLVRIIESAKPDEAGLTWILDTRLKS